MNDRQRAEAKEITLRIAELVHSLRRRGNTIASFCVVDLLVPIVREGFDTIARTSTSEAGPELQRPELQRQVEIYGQRICFDNTGESNRIVDSRRPVTPMEPVAQ